MAILLPMACAVYGSLTCRGCAFSNGTARNSQGCEKDDSGWCSFKSLGDFMLNPWCDYFCNVYGEAPDRFPVSISDSFAMIYDKVADELDVKQRDKVGTCPKKGAKKGEHYGSNNKYQPKHTSWIWDPPPYSAVKKDKWVEVLHEKDPFGDEKHGCWMLKAKGSGIWFNIGKTISFAEHSEAYKHFGVSQGGDMNVKLAKAAADKGYDSIQFTAHHDHTNYPCDEDAGVPYMNIEIVGVKLSGASACCAPSHPKPYESPSFRSGLKADRECTCDTSQEHLNCAGVPTIT